MFESWTVFHYTVDQWRPRQVTCLEEGFDLVGLLLLWLLFDQASQLHLVWQIIKFELSMLRSSHARAMATLGTIDLFVTGCVFAAHELALRQDSTNSSCSNFDRSILLQPL